MTRHTQGQRSVVKTYAPSHFGVTAKRSGQLVELFLNGELDVAAIEVLREALDCELARGARRVVVDLADLEFIDAAGIAELMAGCRRTTDHRGQFCIRLPQPPVRRVLAITGVLASLQRS
jgi:anti-sigma B factor antagonist